MPPELPPDELPDKPLSYREEADRMMVEAARARDNEARYEGLVRATEEKLLALEKDVGLTARAILERELDFARRELGHWIDIRLRCEELAKRWDRLTGGTSSGNG